MATSKSGFLFDHIPKTAGTSLDEAFGRLFSSYRKAEQISNIHCKVVQMPSSEYIGGHFNFFPGEALSQKHYYCTVLRDPVDRFVSQYYFNREFGEFLLSQGALSDIRLSDPQVLASMRVGIGEYIKQQGSIRNTFENVHARHFAARTTSEINTLNSNSLADAAIASLEGYDLVGSFENLQGFLDAVARDFDRESILLAQRNVTGKNLERENISSRVLADLRQANAADYKIIEWARQRFGWESGKQPRLIGTPVERVVSPETSESITVLDTGAGDLRIKIVTVTCFGADAGKLVIAAGESIIVDVGIEAAIVETDLTLGIALRDREGRLVYGVNSLLLDEQLSITKPGNYNARVELSNPLGLGAYSVTVALHKGRSHTDGCYHWLDNAAAFIVSAVSGQPFEGLVDCRAKMRLCGISSNE